MTPWDSQSFRKHNKKATRVQLKAGAKAANRALKSGLSEGVAVRKGNAAIKVVRNNAAKKRRSK